MYSKRERRKIRKTFDNVSEAKRWLNQQRQARDEGSLRVPAKIELADAASGWHELALVGGVRTRSGDPYKPSVVRSYRQSLSLHVLPHLGHKRMGEIERGDVQRLVGLWLSQAWVHPASRTRSTLFGLCTRRVTF